MSKVKLTINKKSCSQKDLVDIPEGTFFTAEMEDYDETAFFKAYDVAVALESGKQWNGNPTFNYYCECDADIALKPVR